MSIYKHFSLNEFKCPCCDKNYISTILVEVLDKVRFLYGKAIYINSGYRCTKHNSDIGGVYDSQHLLGLACDIHCNNSVDRLNLIKHLTKLGIKNIIVYDTFIHIDLRKESIGMIIK